MEKETKQELTPTETLEQFYEAYYATQKYAESNLKHTYEFVVVKAMQSYTDQELEKERIKNKNEHSEKIIEQNIKIQYFKAFLEKIKSLDNGLNSDESNISLIYAITEEALDVLNR